MHFGRTTNSEECLPLGILLTLHLRFPDVLSITLAKKQGFFLKLETKRKMTRYQLMSRFTLE